MPPPDSITVVPQLIRYFRDCLLADGGERPLHDILASGEVEHHFFPISPDSATGIPSTLPLSVIKGERLGATLQIKHQELRPLVGSFLITRGHIDQDPRKIRTPLFIAEAQLEHRETGFFVTPDEESLRINPTALEVLELPTEWERQALPGSSRFPELMERVKHLQTRAAPNGSHGISFARGGGVSLFETSLVWLSRRSQTDASVAYELATMVEQNDPSPCLSQLFAQESLFQPGPASIPESLPSRLSDAQEQALVNAAREKLSVIHGAPGTGKTYTIAGIVADRVMRGESTLICCANDRAADVVYDQLARSFSAARQMVVRAGQGDYRQRLFQQIDDLLARPSDQEALPLAQLEQSLAEKVRQQQLQAQKLASELEKAVRQGAILGHHQPSIFQHFKQRWIAWRTRKSPLQIQVWQSYHQAFEVAQQSARQLLAASTRHRHQTLIQHHRQQLARLANALRARNSGHRQQRMASIDWAILTQAFPIWVVSTQALYRTLPLHKALFDLVIMDEATQCNLAQALPALQRAARAVVVGDRRQLRHFSFLARAKQEALARTHAVDHLNISLNYREHSLLDFAIAGLPHADAQTWLDEHFRSHPQLIQFSNQHFYEQRLKILTSTRRILNQPALQRISCPIQMESDINLGEVQTLMDYLEQRIQQMAHLPDADAPSIGVLCFFSPYAKALEQRILNRFNLGSLTRHQLLVATPYGFQGTERDIILIATGFYPGRAAAALFYIEKPNVFNVAITRARHQILLFLPEEWSPSEHQPLFSAYLNQIQPTPLPVTGNKEGPAKIRQSLMAELEKHSVRCWRDFPIGGQAVDLLAIKGTQKLAIDLVGSPGEQGQAWDISRYHLLERAGLTPLPITYAEWTYCRHELISALLEIFQSPPSSDFPANQQRESLRWRFEKLGATEFLQALLQLEQALNQAKLWLERRFDVNEISYQRYLTALEQLSHATLRELGGIALLLEEQRALELPDERLAERLERAGQQSHQAVQAIVALAQKLALAQSPSNLGQALDEMAELHERLSSYEGHLKGFSEGRPQE